MTAPVRVLRVIARLNAGGPAHHVGVLSSGLDSRGFETLLVHGSVGRSEPELAGFDARYATRRVSVTDLGPALRPAADVRALRRLVRIARAMRPAIVHTHTAKAGLLGRVAALAVTPRPRIVHTYHGHVLEGYFGPLESGVYRSAERWLARRSDRLVGVSRATVDDLLRLGVAPEPKFSVIPLGLELDAFLRSTRADGDHVRRALGLDPEDVLLLSVGRLVPIKRLEVALAATAEARRRGHRLHLAVVGDGPSRPSLERYARECGLGGAVTFLGHRADMVALAAAADIAILTSRNEGTPVSLIEAAAAARPAVATDVGGVREVVTPASGVVVPEGDVAAVASALERLARAPDLRSAMGAAGRRHAAARFTAERLLDDVEALYRELLSRPGVAPTIGASP